MRYLKKIPSTDKELGIKLISEGWTKLKEPSNLGIATLLSIPFMFINAMGSCVDCLNICLVAIQVPKGSYIVNNGFETYFK